MVVEVVLGWLCFAMRHELGYVQFSGQQQLCLFGWWLLLDAFLGQRLSVLDGVGDLFLDKVFFFRSSLFRTTFFYGAWYLDLFSLSLTSPALLVPLSPSFIFFSPQDP